MPIFEVPVEITFPGPGSPGVNVWHVRTSGGVFAGELQDMIDAIRDFYDGFNQFMPTTVHYKFKGEVVDVQSRELSVGLTPFTIDGTSSTVMLPTVLCLVAGWRTSQATRSGRGRTFVGPFVNTEIDADGSPSAAMVSAVQGAADALVSDSTGNANGAVVVWSPTDGVGRDITGAKVRDSFAVLRSRRGS